MSPVTEYSWQSMGMTDVGMVRKVNEDALLDRSDIGLWVVADGMGGHYAGDVASRAIVESLNTLTAKTHINDFVEDVQDHLWDVNRALRAEAAQLSSRGSIGSTVVALLATNGRCASLWVGDSRVYRLRDGAFQAVTRDHSQVQEMVDLGLISSEVAKTHPAANIITRAVGAVENLVVDVRFDDIRDGDRYLLCSDGLYKEVSEEEMANLMRFSSCSEQVAKSLMRLALDRGARDNVTVLAIQFRTTKK